MDTYIIDPSALRRIALDLAEAARAVDRAADVELPPRLPFAGDSEVGTGRLVTAAHGVALAATVTADDLERVVVDNQALDGEIAGSLLDLRIWRP